MTAITVGIALAAAAAMVGGVLVRLATPVAVGLAGLALAYAVGLHLLPGALHVPSAVVAGAGLLVVGELGFDLISRPSGRPADGREAIGARQLVRRARRPATWLAACALAAALAAVFILGVASIPLQRALLPTLAGALAAGVAVWLVARAVRRAVGPDRR